MLMAGAASVLVSVAMLGTDPDGSRANEPEVFPDEHILGSPDAPITIIEYSSLTCPHCASFHETTLPKLKETWIANGKAKLVYRHFPLDRLALGAALVANCLDGDRYFNFIEVLFRRQDRWAGAEDPVAELGQLATMAGIDREKFDVCLKDEAELNRILERRQKGEAEFGISSTPTFIINGRKVQGAVSFEEFNKLLGNVDT
jgi:protein-disulfide isomerase